MSFFIFVFILSHTSAQIYYGTQSVWHYNGMNGGANCKGEGERMGHASVQFNDDPKFCFKGDKSRGRRAQKRSCKNGKLIHKVYDGYGDCKGVPDYTHESGVCYNSVTWYNKYTCSVNLRSIPSVAEDQTAQNGSNTAKLVVFVCVLIAVLLMIGCYVCRKGKKRRQQNPKDNKIIARSITDQLLVNEL